jgi:forkhead transcription factor HCM1
MPLQPLRNAPNQYPEPVFNPAYASMQQISPNKMQHVSPPQGAYPHMNFVPIPPPQMQSFTDSPMKKHAPAPQHPQQYCIQPSPPPPPPQQQQPLFHTFNSNFDAYEPENYHPSSSTHDNADFPEPNFLRRNGLKRSYSDVNHGERPLKRPRVNDEPTVVPEPEDMPVIEDDGNKPPYSYAQMIGMAILRAPQRRLTLAQIYEWISTTFAFYREDTKMGWHNSVRHNLSLKDAFSKVERPKGDAGKGCYWVIEPGMEGQFLKDKSRKGNGITNITVHPTVMRPDILSASQPLPELAPAFIPEAIEERPHTAPALPEFDSDATLPASDPALIEEDVDAALMPPPQSSPPDGINSSPPIATHRRAGSSPTARKRQATSLMKHKRNATMMDDSGYFSSLESSIVRPNTKNNIVLTSELDVEPARKKQRGGRAEDEIQRIRSSSHDLTPSHNRIRNVNFAVGPQTSSPPRPSPATNLAPTTPSVLLKKSACPPPSVSPDTQLYHHRRQMQEQFANSPSAGLFGLAANRVVADALPETNWSPFHMTPGPAADAFEIFSDPILAMTPATPGYNSSPLKSVRRPGLTRAATTAAAGVLTEVLGNASNRLNAKTPSRLPKTGFLKPREDVVYTGSPLKGQVPTVAIVDDENDFFDFDNFENENELSDEGVDLSKGFGKIGATALASKRPGLGGRSATSLF